MRLLVVLPLYDDWECLPRLADELVVNVGSLVTSLELLIIDDASSKAPPSGLMERLSNRIGPVTRLRLARNMGHQRAIAVGIASVSTREDIDAVLVMDADGEDDPQQLPKLLDRFFSEGSRKVVFARRGRRWEGTSFRLFYWLYRGLHRIATGRSISVGNHCVIPRAELHRLALTAELWTHFSAGLIRSKVDWTTVDLPRGKRYFGESKMGFQGLVMHGLSAISVYSDLMGIRALILTAILSVLLTAGIIAVIAIKFFTELAIPGWASMLTGLFVVILIQMVMSSLLFAFLVLGRRSGMSLTPLREHAQFILRAERFAGKSD